MEFIPNKVIYHNNCSDGFAAAYAIWKHAPAYRDIQYIPMSFSDRLPSFLNSDKILVIDFSFSKEVCDKINDQALKFQILDHHKTAYDELKDCKYAKFDMTKSGAMLAWEWCTKEEPPDLIKYVQDRDLWKLELPMTREYSAALRSYPFNFEIWDKLGTEKLKEEGIILVEATKTAVAQTCKNAFTKKICGYDVPVVNASLNFSEVGAWLLKLYPEAKFSVYYFDKSDGYRQWGLRSKPDFDCSVIAKKFGGGGHPQSSGFTTEISKNIYDHEYLIGE